MAITKGTMTIGILAIFSGLLAAYGVRSLMMKEEVAVPAKPAPPIIKVPVASLDLPADRLLTVGDISIFELTQAQLRERFKGTDVSLIMTRAADIIGRRLHQPLKQGQPFLTTALYLEGTGPSLTEKLPPAFRAINLQVSDSHGGNVQPGTHVDVVFRSQARSARDGELAIPEVTLTLLRHIEVLEVTRPSATQAAADQKTALVTLAIPVEKLGVLSAVEGRGELWLAATSPRETEGLAAAPSAGLTLEELLGIQPPQAPFQTAIYRRSQIQINTFVAGKLVSQSSGPSAMVWPSGTCPNCGPQGSGTAPAPIPEPSPRGDSKDSLPAPRQPKPAGRHT